VSFGLAGYNRELSDACFLPSNAPVIALTALFVYFLSSSLDALPHQAMEIFQLEKK
jgi:hypothetical protein